MAKEQITPVVTQLQPDQVIIVEKGSIDPTKPLKNLRHEAFAKELVANNFNKTKAYEVAYRTSKENAQSNAHAVMDYQGVNERVQYLMEENKRLNLPSLVQTLARQTQAKKALIVPKGSVVQWIDDNTAQGQALEKSLKLHGLLKSGSDVNIDNRQAHITINADQSKHLESLATKLLEINQRLGLSATETNEPDGEVTKKPSGLDFESGGTGVGVEEPNEPPTSL